jgi:hypothetical protein
VKNALLVVHEWQIMVPDDVPSRREEEE